MNHLQLRKRPFMVITFSRTPYEGMRTNIKGWADNAEAAWQANENMVIVDSVSTKHQLEADFILDLMNQKLVKNRMGVDEKTVFQGYVDRYYSEVKMALTRWVANSGGSLDTIRALAKEETDKAEDGEADTVDQEWSNLIEEVQTLIAEGAKPDSLEALVLVKHWVKKLQDVTGDMTATVKMYDESFADPKTAGQIPFSLEVWEFVKASYAAGCAGEPRDL